MGGSDVLSSSTRRCGGLCYDPKKAERSKVHRERSKAKEEFKDSECVCVRRRRFLFKQKIDSPPK